MALVRGESVKLSRERRGPLDRKSKLSKLPLPVAELLEELVGLRTFTAIFFVREHGLCSKGLNLKNSAEMLFITVEKIKGMWGKCTSFKTTNTTLKLEMRSQLLELYSKIYNKVDITNKEFMLWLVKGNIVAQMDFEVDWASAAASTAYILACRLKSDLLKRNLTPKEIETLACLAPTSSSKPSGSQSKYTIRSNGVREERKQKLVIGFGSPQISLGEITDRAWRLPHISLAEITKTEEVLIMEAELLAIMEKKERFLESLRKIIVEKIIGFKFGVDDCKIDVEEAIQNVNVVEEGLKSNDSLINEVQSVVSVSIVFSFLHPLLCRWSASLRDQTCMCIVWQIFCPICIDKTLIAGI